MPLTKLTGTKTTNLRKLPRVYKVSHFSAIADMTVDAESLYDTGSVIETNGFYEDSREGSAKYFLLTDADKITSVYEGTEGYACIAIGDYWACLDLQQDVSLYSFGVVTDGTIQTTLINGAVAFCVANHLQLNVTTDSNNPTYYDIDDTIIIPNRGLSLIGQNMRQVVFRNNVNNAPLMQVGDKDTKQHAQFSNLQNFSLEGNVATAEGLALLGIDDDSMLDASKVCSIDRVRIVNTLAGDALRISSWNNNLGLIEIENSKNGLRIGNEANACNFDNLRITNCSEHGVYTQISNTARTSAVNFNTLTVQQCGDATHPAILINAGRGYNINTLYLEDNRGDTVVSVDAVQAFNVGVCTYAHSGLATQDIFVISGESSATIGNTAVFGTVNSHVRVEGASTKTVIFPITQQTGSVTTDSIIDNTTNKQTVSFHEDGLGVQANRFVVNQISGSSGGIIVNSGGTEYLRIKGNGEIDFTNSNSKIRNSTNSINFDADGVESARVDSSSISGATRFLLYDISAASLKRVKVGASDSGGTGQKILTVDN